MREKRETCLPMTSSTAPIRYLLILLLLPKEQAEDLQHLESGAAIAPSIAALDDLSNPASTIAQLILGN